MNLIAAALALVLPVIGYLIGRYLLPWVDPETPRRISRRAQTALAGLRDLASGDRREALRALLTLVERDTDDPAVYLTLGSLFAEEGALRRAEAIFAALLVRPDLSRPDRARAALGLAKVRQRRGDRAGALRALDDRLKDQIDDPASWRLYSDLLAQLEIFDRAADAWKRAKGEPRHLAHLYASRGEQLLSSQDRKGAKKALKAALSSDAEGPQVLYLQGRLQLLDGEVLSSVSSLAKALSFAPRALPQIIPILEEANQRLSSEEELRRAFAPALSSERPWVQLALIRLLASREPQSAIKELSASKPLPSSLEALHLTSKLALSQDDPKVLREALSEVLSFELPPPCRCGLSSPIPAWCCPRCGRPLDERAA